MSSSLISRKSLNFLLANNCSNTLIQLAIQAIAHFVTGSVCLIRVGIQNLPRCEQTHQKVRGTSCTSPEDPAVIFRWNMLSLRLSEGPAMAGFGSHTNKRRWSRKRVDINEEAKSCVDSFDQNAGRRLRRESRWRRFRPIRGRREFQTLFSIFQIARNSRIGNPMKIQSYPKLYFPAVLAPPRKFSVTRNCIFPRREILQFLVNVPRNEPRHLSSQTLFTL